MVQGLKMSHLIKKNIAYLFHRMQKTAKKCTFSRFFHWMTSRFRPLRKNGLSWANADNGLIIYDDLSFIQYNNDYYGASSSPDHRVRQLMKFRKYVFSFNGDVMVIAH